MARTRWYCLFLCAPLLGVPVRAIASESTHPTAQLKLHRPTNLSQCPDEPSLRSLTRAQLGYEAFVNDAARLVTVTFGEATGALTATIEIREAGRTHKRELRSTEPSCQELAHATAFALALAIDPFHIGEPAPKPMALSCPPCSAATPPRMEKKPRQWSVGVAPLLTFGTTPGKVGFGLALHTALRIKDFEIGLEGRVDPQVARTHSTAGDVGASLYLASLVPCMHVRYFFGCATFGVGALRGVGFSTLTNREQTTVYANGGWRMGVEWQTRQLALRFYGEVTATFTRTTLGYATTPVWTSPPVAGNLGLSILYLFP